MLLSKLGSGDALQSENSALMNEVDLLKQENAALNEAVSHTDKQCACLQEEINTMRSSIQSNQADLNAKRLELESKTKELQGVKDTLTTLRAEMDRELSRLEDDLRKSEEQARSMQIELMERTHAETRLKSELHNSDGRYAQLEAENMTLRRRLLGAGEERDRDVSLLQNRVLSLESELRSVLDDLARARSTGSSLDVNSGGYGGHVSAYISQPPTRTFYPPPAPLPTHSLSNAYSDRDRVANVGSTRDMAGGLVGTHPSDRSYQSSFNKDSSMVGPARQGSGSGSSSGDGDVPIGTRVRSINTSRQSLESSGSSLRMSGERDRNDFDRYGSSVDSTAPQHRQNQPQPKTLRDAFPRGPREGARDDDSRE